MLRQQNVSDIDDIETVINSLCEELVAKDTENHTDERNRINNCEWNCSKTGRNQIAIEFETDDKKVDLL